jgi:hypothetical protein
MAARYFASVVATPIEAARPCHNHAGRGVESAFAHIEGEPGSMVALCGYRGKRRGTSEEAAITGYCVVCVDLYGGRTCGES